jgi:restriction system protein
MVDTVECNNCGLVLHEDLSEDVETRKPCPNCGSTKRKLFLHAQVGQLTIKSLGATLTVFRSISLVIQTAVVPGERTTEGQLIEAVALPWFEIIELLKNDFTIAYQIPARKWEEIIAGAYKKAGFDEVTLTPRSGDYGRDVIAVKRGLGFVRVIDQVKAYKPGHLVTADDVRALMGVLQGDGASKGFLTTTSDFAPNLHKDPLITQFIPRQLELINGDALLQSLKQLAEK